MKELIIVVISASTRNKVWLARFCNIYNQFIYFRFAKLTRNNNYDEFFHIGLGEKLLAADPWIIYCGFFDDGFKIRAIIHCGVQASKSVKAGDIAKAVSEVLGGAGGGNANFAQGGGSDKSKVEEAVNKAKSMVLN